MARPVRISGLATYVPPRVLTNDDLEHMVDTTDAWIFQRTGIRERHLVEPGQATSDLAEPASRAAIAEAGLTPADIDFIVVGTTTPDTIFPSTACVLQAKIGATNAWGFDLGAACSGFLYSLSVGCQMVATGAAEHALVVGADVMSSIIDYTDRSTCILFGDGAGAVVVSATEEDRGVRGTWLGADGRFAETLCQKVWDIRKRPFIPVNAEGVGQVDASHMYAQMEGKTVFKHAVEKMCLAVMQACWATSTEPHQIDLFFFHQANMRINQYVAKTLGLPEDKVVHNIQRYGNTTAATIPILLAEAEREGRLKRGMKVAMVAFGSGFTWGSALVDW
jgi:3-oxoacyl-[acyl-carrier-protein] synthase-3